MKRKIIVNPASGNGRTGTSWRSLEHLFRQHFPDLEPSTDIAFTYAVEDATILTLHALQHENCEHIIVVGGDGTFSEVVNGYFINNRPINPSALLSFVPSGTGSDIARTLGVSTDKAQAIQSIAQRSAQYRQPVASEMRPLEIPSLLDVGALTLTDDSGAPFSMYFINVASCGISGLVVRHINAARTLKRLGGRVAFYTATVRAMMDYRTPAMRVVVYHDDREIWRSEKPTYAVAVANGRYFGSGMKIAPDADMRDGLLDIVLIEKLPLGRAITQLQSVYSGRHLSLPEVYAVRGTSVSIEPLDNNQSLVFLDVDGEAPGQAPAAFSVLPSALRFL